jgi:hypothetical protein
MRKRLEPEGLTGQQSSTDNNMHGPIVEMNAHEIHEVAGADGRHEMHS